jgi:sortase A
LSGDTIVAPPAAAPLPNPRQSTVGDKIRFALRGIGQTLITLGLVVLLFAVYEVWITNIFAHREQVKVYNALHQEWLNGVDPLSLPTTGPHSIPPGTGIAVLYIPRLGQDYHFAIVQGSVVPDDSQLEKGPAHYADTQMPGEVGNFGVAGHRVGKGEPFLNLDKLRSGDTVIVETKAMWWIYKVLGQPAGADPEGNMTSIEAKPDASTDPAAVTSFDVPGREIVDPSDGNVLLPIPNHPGYVPTHAALMTMTTCHPKFTASHRMIVHAQLATQYPNSRHWIASGKFPPQVAALYQEVNA